MKRCMVILFFSLVFVGVLNAQEQLDENKDGFLTGSDFDFLEALMKDVLESSRIYPEQKITSDSIPNHTGNILIRPGGRDSYPSFWIRDYAMSLECGFITKEEQQHMLLLTAATQCEQTWITQGGSMIPLGAIADHIRIDDGLPIYFPGTYDVDQQGNKTFGMFPPYGDQFLFIHMAYYYVKSTSSAKILLDEINGMKLMDRLELAFKVPPTRKDNHIVYTTDEYRGVDFGFRDVIQITGDLCFPSILKYRASTQMAELFEMINRKEKAARYRTIAEKLKNAIPSLFMDQRGMLLASSGKSNQPDVWSTALAVFLNILEGEAMIKSCHFLAEAYKDGTLSYKGNIRHVLTSDDYDHSTAWEVSLARKDTYQNGAYWGTPTGWVCYAIAKADYPLARQLAREYIDDLRENDYRKGKEYGAPYECFHPSGHQQNPVYLTTLTCPYIVFGAMKR
jgi:hypothetical protein